MGMYTEFVFACELKQEMPKDVVNILKDMTTGDIFETYKNYKIPNHDFFKCDRWKCLFTMDSYYFPGATMSRFTEDNICGTSYYLTIRSNLKNYDSEIEKFLDFIYPYVNSHYEESEFLGYYRYEENKNPQLIYCSNMNKFILNN